MAFHLDWGRGHQPVHAVANAALSSAAAAMVGHVTHLPPWWGITAGVVGGAASLATSARHHLTTASSLFRASCWVGAGTWTSLAMGNPWAPGHFAALAAGTLGAGVLAPVFAREEHTGEQQRRLPAVRERTRIAEEWEERLSRVCRISGAEVRNVEPWETGTGFTLDVELPGGGHTWQDISRHAQGLASDARLPVGCGVEATGGIHRGAALIHVATTDALQTTRDLPADDTPTTINAPFPIGVHRDASEVLASLRYHCGLLVGQTDSGKTNTLQVCNAQLVRCVDTVVWHIDLAGGGIALPWLLPWYEGRADRPAIDWLAPTPDEATAMVGMAIEIINLRKMTYRKLMREADDDKIPVSPAVPEVIIVADEFAELPGRIQDALVTISNTGRAAGIRTLCCALRATADIVPVPLKKQARVRIGMRVSDPEELSFLFGWSAKTPEPEDIPHQGSGVVSTDDTAGMRPFRSYRLAPSRIDDIAVAVADIRPALDEASAAAPGVFTAGRTVLSYAEVYASRHERMRGLLATGQTIPLAEPEQTTITPAPQAGSGSAADAVAVAQEAVRRVRRAAAEADGGDPAIDEEFQAIVHAETWGLSPSSWPTPEQILSGHSEDGGDPDRLDRMTGPRRPAPPPPPAAPPTPPPMPETPTGARRSVDAKERCGQLLEAAGADGISPGELTRRLNQEGYPTTRQTVSDWLAAACAARPPAAVKLSRGLYAAPPDNNA